MIRVTVLYPFSEGTKFDVDYYVNSHMKLVRERLSAHAVSDIRVEKGLGGGRPGDPPPFHCIGQMNFPSLENFQQGFAAHGKEFREDIPNFTDVPPTIQVSEVHL